MAPDPADRLPGAEALRDALAAVGLDAVPPAAASATGNPAPPHSPGVAPETDPLAASDRNRKRSRLLRAAVPAVALAVAVLGTAGVLAYQGQGQDRRSSAKASAGSSGTSTSSQSAEASAGADFKVPTTTEDCPAAAVEGVNARCTTTAECWGGMVVIAGNVTVNRADCLVEHAWETYAIAPLPSDGMTVNQQELEKHPDVRRLCSRAVMAKSRQGKALRIAPARWTVDVIPPSPTEYVDGLRVLRCVATVTGQSSIGTYFRPRS
jgi:hypothetical protein